MIEQWTEFKPGMFRSKNVNEPLRIAPYNHFDPFQIEFNLPCWDHKSATAYAIRSYQERELAEIKSCTDSIDKVLNNAKMNDQQQVLMISFIIKQILKKIVENNY